MELTRLFNSRELLFGVASTDYTKFKKIVDQFAPFFYLWDTTESWKSSYNTWMNDPFDSLDALQIDDKVNGWFKGLYKTLREFQKLELLSQSESTQFIREQVIMIVYSYYRLYNFTNDFLYF